MSGGLVGIRLALPEGWHPLDLDDPDACMADLVDELLPSGPGAGRRARAPALLDEYGLLALGAPQDLVVLLESPSEGVTATLVTSLTTARTLLRRGLAGHAAAVARDLRVLGARRVTRSSVALPSGPAVRLRAVARDETGRPREVVAHVVVPPGAAGAVVLRVMWAPGRPDAEELASLADRLAREALVEVLA